MSRFKAPYKVLFSNDTTNIEQCTSPFNPQRWLHHGPVKPFSREILQAAVDETAGTGIDVHMLQPGVGWVPWWKSRKYPYAEHVRFMKERYGMEPSASGFAQYMADGGDIVQVFVDRCREKALAPFISFRLNDSHGHELVHAEPGTLEGWAWHCLSPWHVNHPEWRIGQNLTDWNNRVLNWAIPEVRQQKFDYIREIIEQYDIDGFELDYMRTNSYFRLNETPLAERRKIMLDFVSDVRAVLDATAKPGQHRWLCVRIPCRISRHDELGVDVEAFYKAGVDMINLCSSFFTEQQSDIAEITKRLPDAAVYLEATSAASLGAYIGGYDQTFRRMTDEEFYTAGHLAFSRGGSGTSTFNFVYYREHHGNDKIGPFTEPPYHIFKGLADPNFLATQPQHYFVPRYHGGASAAGELPDALVAGASFSLALDMAPPTGGWSQAGRLRIQAEGDLADSRWTARINGIELESTNDVSEPYPSPYPNCWGKQEDYRAWIVPANLPRDGMNTVEVTMQSGDQPVKIAFVDLAVR